MWTRLDLQNFKCFGRLRLPLAPLTLLTGLNAAGKSTVLQSLALLHQSIREDEWGHCLLLNGPAVRLGSVRDVVNRLHGRHGFEIGLASDEGECHWTASGEHVDLVATLKRVRINQPGAEEQLWEPRTLPPCEGADQVAPAAAPALQRLVPRDVTSGAQAAALALTGELRRLAYVSAERLGPRETYDVFSEDEVGGVGVRGERSAFLLHRHAERLVTPALRLDGEPPQFPRQVGAWLDRFFPGAALRVEPVRGANLVTLALRARAGGDFYRPQNVGYGLTHILPILTACLHAAPGGALLIDNPEAHLHPSGQARMGDFLCRVAAAGAQVIMETHSDHVLNGVRRAVREGVLNPASVAIHFFGTSAADKGEEASPRVTSPLIDKRGSLDHWPEGFFDQFDKDMMALADWGTS